MPDRLPLQQIQPQKLLQSLPRSRERAVAVRRLLSALEVPESQEALVHRLLDEFVRAGLASVKAGRYWRQKEAGLLIGTARGTRAGKMFVIPDDEREQERGDVFVNEGRLGTAMHGDKVIVRISAQGPKGRSGSVEAVLSRAVSGVVGRISRPGSEWLVLPIDERFVHEISVSPADAMAANDGDIVTVVITRPPIAGRLPAGRVTEVLGPPDGPGMDLEIIVRKHHLRRVFPDQVLAQAGAISEEISEADLSGRIDLRGKLTITIDGETARDFDDAVSLEPLPNGRLLLGVHIADVSHYVREGSPVDDEAFNRGTSVYFPEKAIPMLPEKLSNTVCSLNPGRDRLTMSVLLELDEDAQIVDYRIAPSAIHSRERMTYTDVNAILVDPTGETAASYPELVEMLVQMRSLAVVLIRQRDQRGAIDFDIPEAEVLFDDEGQVSGIVRSVRNVAHRLIEEFMLMANETVARHLEALDVPIIYRVHDQPDASKLEEFQEIAESFGHKFSIHGPIPQRGFQHVLRQVEGLPEEKMLSYLMLRSMERARYSPKNNGHFGLAMATYTHFTSPIRRYPDLIVHRILKETLERGANGGGAGLKAAADRKIRPIPADRRSEIRSRLDSIAAISSERELGADNAERELMDWRKAEFMAGRVGDEFTGVISSVKEWGLYVELDDVFIEGLVHTSTLVDDLYEYQPRRHRLVGVRTGRVFRLGEAVRVRVDRVDLTRHLIDLSVTT